MLDINSRCIKLLEEKKYFSNDSMNVLGLEYVKYLTSTQYFDLFNPEPVNTDKNTLAMALNYIRNIDGFVKKSIEKYTRDDITKFIDAFLSGKIKSRVTRVINRNGKRVSEVSKSDSPLSPNNLKRHIHAFKRFWAVYRQYVIHVEKQAERIGSMEWGTLVRAPKQKSTYVKYPYLTLQQIIDISESLCKPEYTARMLISVNLMGRKCEISSLKHKDIDTNRDKDKVFIQLPDIKKYSSDKVPVELFDYCKKRLIKYLQVSNLNKQDILFPSKEEAFAKELCIKSEAILGKGNLLTPKTLRKLGVCVAREIGIDRTTVEDIGGWKRNSPVLEHYYTRGGVAITTDVAKKADIIEHEDVYLKMDKLSQANRQMSEKLELFEKIILTQLNNKKGFSLKDKDLLEQAYSIKTRRK